MIKEGVPVYPMQWVETDKNAHKRRTKGDYTEVPPKLKSRRVGCGNFENSIDLLDCFLDGSGVTGVAYPFHGY